MTGGLQVLAAVTSYFGGNAGVAVLNAVAAACSMTLWVLARKREQAAVPPPASEV
ncbi:hypothetical protein ACIPY2_18595 [Paenarthrobacter sp. NPDC089675]|uniref:hypothetical protein n=1 Tax=Paenarthrobacter sp. NPDC089675 TaxID=3364376 RepID=UPI00382C4D92